MRIVLKVPKSMWHEILRGVRELSRNEEYWHQPTYISRNGKVASFSTFSGKGDWKFNLKKDHVRVEFDGYRGSFMDGSYALSTSGLMRDGASIVEFESSEPDRQPTIYLGEGKMLYPLFGEFRVGSYELARPKNSICCICKETVTSTATDTAVCAFCMQRKIEAPQDNGYSRYIFERPDGTLEYSEGS